MFEGEFWGEILYKKICCQFGTDKIVFGKTWGLILKDIEQGSFVGEKSWNL